MEVFSTLRLKLRQNIEQPPEENLAQKNDDVVNDAESKQVAAGRIAEEEFLASMLKVNGVNKCSLFPGLRVPAWTKYTDVISTTKEGFEIIPVPKRSCKSISRGEIDLVVVSQKGIYLLEIKNWSGTVSADGMKDENWYQHKRNGNVIIHPNAVQTTSEKAANLHVHLNREGCAVPSQAILPRVIFVNPRIDIDPIILNSGKVIVASDLAEFIGSFGRSPLEAAKDRWLPRWMTGCEINEALVKRAQHVLKYTVGTWDVLTLNNGQRLIGDFIDAVVSEGPNSKSKTKVLQNFETLGGRVKHSKLIFCAATSDPITWIGTNVFGWYAPKVDVVARPRKSETVDPDKDLATKLTETIQSIVDDTLASLLPWKVAGTLSSEDGILFHCCGQKEPKRLPVSDVYAIDLSRI